MNVETIQKSFTLSTQVTVTVEGGTEISGQLTEIALDHITLDIGNDRKVVLQPNAIIMISNQVEAQEPSVPTPVLTPVSESSEIAPIQVEEPESSDTIHVPPEAIKPSDTTPISTEEPELSDTIPVTSEAVVSSEPTPDQTDLAVPPSDTDPISTEEPELSDTTPIPSETAESSESTPDQTDSVEFDEGTSEKLHEIESRFDTEIQSAKIDLEPLNITFSAIAEKLPGWQNTGVTNAWKPIEDQYKHAVKIGELDTKFGRIQQITEKAKNLVERFPRYPALKQVLAYFYSILNKWDEALQNYAEAAAQSGAARDWFNVAVSASKLNKEEIVCFSLEEFFCEVSIVDKPQAWFVYVNLLEKFNNLPAFHDLCEIDNIKDDEIEFLLNTAIYLLKKTGAETFGTRIIEKWLSGGSPKLLLEEARQELDGQPTESYYEFMESYDQFVMEFSIVDENLYEEAKKADQSGNLVSAERLYKECIRRNIRRDTVIMDLAMVYVQLDRAEEAAQLLEENRSKVKYTQRPRLDNLLTTTVYPKAGQYEKVIDFLNNALKLERNEEKRSQFFLQIANAYIRLRNYSSAESQCLQALKLRPDNIAVQRSLAICVFQQGRSDQAIGILNEIQDTSPTAKTAELLDAIEKAKATGEFILDDDSFIPAPSDFLGELSEFARFFLDRCTFEGLRSERKTERVRNGKYIGTEEEAESDIKQITDVATAAGPSNPRTRSAFNLAIAKIYLDIGNNRDSFYRNLCRTFVSKGDAAVIDNGNLDAIREWYCEALTAYDGNTSHSENDDSLDTDLSASLVRYLYATLGTDYIPHPPNIPQLDQAVAAVILSHSDHLESEKVFEAIAYLVSHSGYAANKILKHLYDNPNLRSRALNYLQKIEITFSSTIKDLKDFKQPWSVVRDKQFNKASKTLNDLLVLKNFEFSAAWLKGSMEYVKNIRSNLFFELDKQRVEKLGEILKIASEIFDQEDFVERERRCLLINNFCEELLKHVEANPTKLSIAGICPIVAVIQEKANEYLEWLYENRKPDLTITLADEGRKHYTPVDGIIKVQIVLVNQRGRMPADALRLVIQADEKFCKGPIPDQHLPLLSGGGKEAQEILHVPLTLTNEALKSPAFSLVVHVEYGIRGGDREPTPPTNLSVRLKSEDEFVRLVNPYAPYASGNRVGDPDMFFGRGELIENIADAILESRFQSKSVLVYGQYRSGKSSVLYHLNKKIQEEEKYEDLLILDLGDISYALDADTPVPITYQMLIRILSALKKAAEDKIKGGSETLGFSIPNAQEFTTHPTPLQFFEDIFEKLKASFKEQGWSDVQVVLLIDEFQYIYDLIVKRVLQGEIFMKFWKALLHGNHFSAVLVGQDVMPKFKGEYSNQFGTTQSQRVTYLTPDDAKNLIDLPIRIGGRQGESRYLELAIDRILGLTAGSPYYIQIVCDRLVEYMNREKVQQVTEADVEKVKEELIKGENPLDEDTFHNFISSGDESEDAIPESDAKKVLEIIAKNSGTDTDGCPRHSIVCDTDFDVDEILADLVRREVVEQHRQSYRIRAGLFKEWLVVNK